MRAYARVGRDQGARRGREPALHEDSQRFSNALQGCLATALDALFTLGVFTPVLLKLSREVPPPVSMGPIRDGWLLVAALLAASVGLNGAILFGRALVSLEVNNQKVKVAAQDLVLLETTPAVIVGVPNSEQTYAPCQYFHVTLQRLSRNCTPSPLRCSACGSAFQVVWCSRPALSRRRCALPRTRPSASRSARSSS